MPAPARGHAARGDAATGEHAVEVHAHGEVPVGVIHVCHGHAKRAQPRVVAQHVQRAQVFLDAVGRLLPGCAVRHVQPQREHAVAMRLEFLRPRTQAILVDVGHGDRHAGLRQGAREGEADAASRARDEGRARREGLQARHGRTLRCHCSHP